MIIITKAQAIADPNSCWNKAADDEPVFILCGHDINAGAAIRIWAVLTSVAARQDGADHSPWKAGSAACEVAPAFEAWAKEHGKVAD